MVMEVEMAMAEVAMKVADNQGPSPRAASETCRIETHHMMTASDNRRPWVVAAAASAVMLAGSSLTSCRRMGGRAADRELIRCREAMETSTRGIRMVEVAPRTNERMMLRRSPWTIMISPVMSKEDVKSRGIGTRVARTTREISLNQRASMMTRMMIRMRMIGMRVSMQLIKGIIVN